MAYPNKSPYIPSYPALYVRLKNLSTVATSGRLNTYASGANTTVNFYKDELLNLEINYVKDLQIIEPMNLFPVIYEKQLAPRTADCFLHDPGKNRIVKVTLKHSKADTITRIIQLAQSHYLMELWWRYLEFYMTGDGYVQGFFIMDPNYKTTYRFGQKSALHTSELMFYETNPTFFVNR